MLAHFVSNAVLNAAWYATYKSFQAGQEHFHSIFTIFAPFAVPAYRSFVQSAPQYNFGLKQWIMYTLCYWGLLLGTRDSVELVTLGSPFLDDLLTLFRITVAVFWFSMFRNGLKGSIRNIWQLISRTFSCISFALVGVSHANEVWCRSTANSLQEDMSDDKKDGNPSICVDDNNNAQHKKHTVGKYGSIPEPAVFMRTASACVGAALPFVGALWLILVLWVQFLYNSLTSAWKWMTDRPVWTCTGLFVSSTVIAVTMGEGTRPCCDWLFSNRLPVVIEARFAVLPVIVATCSLIIAFSHTTERFINVYEFLMIAQASLKHHFSQAGFVDNVYLGGRRIASVAYGAYDFTHVTFLNARLVTLWNFAVRPARVAISRLVRGAVDGTVRITLDLLPTLTGIVLGCLCYSHRYYLCIILCFSKVLLAAVLGAYYWRRNWVSSWKLVPMSPRMALITTTFNICVGRALVLVGPVAALARFWQYYLPLAMLSASDGIASWSRLRRDHLVASGRTAIANFRHLNYGILAYGIVAGLLLLSLTAVAIPLLVEDNYMALGFREISIHQMLLASSSLILAHWYYRHGLPTAGVDARAHGYFRSVLLSLMLIGFGGMIHAMSSLFRFSPHTVVEFIAGSRITNVDLRRPYREIGRLWYMRGEPNAISQVEQLMVASQTLAEPTAACQYLADDVPLICMTSQGMTSQGMTSPAYACSRETAAATVGLAAEIPTYTVDILGGEEIVSEVIYMGQVCYDEDGDIVPCW